MNFCRGCDIDHMYVANNLSSPGSDCNAVGCKDKNKTLSNSTGSVVMGRRKCLTKASDKDERFLLEQAGFYFRVGCQEVTLHNWF